MDCYAAMLNLDRIEEHALKKQDIFEVKLQESISRRVMLGVDGARGLAIDKAVKKLLNENFIETYECSACVQVILQHETWKGNIRHLWITDNKGTLELHALPYHDTLVEFCDRYSLSEEAMRDLATFIRTIIYKR